MAIGTVNAFWGDGKLPRIHYSGSYRLVPENKSDWKLYLYTSGTLSFQSLGTGNGDVEIWMCGGGGAGGGKASSTNFGGGGCGGKVNMVSMTLTRKTNYSVTIGAGGVAGAASNSPGGNGGQSAFEAFRADGGDGGKISFNGAISGGTGGSGGGSGGTSGNANGGNGGTNGSDGTGYYPGLGSGKNTHEFGDDALPIYCGGGGGSGGTGTNIIQCGTAGDETATDGANRGNAFHAPDNRGGGGGGSSSFMGGNGGSGIVIIRNRRA